MVYLLQSMHETETACRLQGQCNHLGLRGTAIAPHPQMEETAQNTGA